jgi:hypothetical protein
MVTRTPLNVRFIRTLPVLFLFRPCMSGEELGSSCFQFTFIFSIIMSRDSVVGIVTRLRAGRSGVRFATETDFYFLQNV